MAVVNNTKLRCKAVEALYNYLINRSYGVECEDAFGEEVALNALRDYWVYTTSTTCPYDCNTLDIERNSNVGCNNIVLCTDYMATCNLIVEVSVSTNNCTPININIS